VLDTDSRALMSSQRFWMAVKLGPRPETIFRREEMDLIKCRRRNTALSWVRVDQCRQDGLRSRPNTLLALLVTFKCTGRPLSAILNDAAKLLKLKVGAVEELGVVPSRLCFRLGHLSSEKKAKLLKKM
jgi:hypothetical protein